MQQSPDCLPRHSSTTHSLSPTQSCELHPGLIELFVDGKEDSLPDAGRLDELGLGEGSVVFMLQRESWCWTECGGQVTLSEGGLVATKTGATGASWQLVTGGEPMTEGRHYWEVQLTSGKGIFAVGALRPDLWRDHGTDHMHAKDAFFIHEVRARSSGLPLPPPLALALALTPSRRRLHPRGGGLVEPLTALQHALYNLSAQCANTTLTLHSASQLPSTH